MLHFSSLPVGVLVIATQGTLAVLPSDAFLHPIVQVDDPIGSYQRQQALLQEVQDRFGCLFMDFKGTSKMYFLAAWLTRLLVPALKGLLLGWFASSECASLTLLVVAGSAHLRFCLAWGWGSMQQRAQPPRCHLCINRLIILRPQVSWPQATLQVPSLRWEH